MEQHYEGLNKILTHYGIANQTEKLHEELKELMHVIEHDHKSQLRFIRSICGEIADVLILIQQIMMHYNLEQVVATIVKYKIERTLYEINLEEKHDK